ncbi:MAG: hypothetical protein J6A69_01365 [Clostridia bacterium]|nr:hypothetical protein [Clostridia bacterium]
MTKIEHALEACDKVLEGFELGTIAVSSALLLCMRIARLLNDFEAIEWLTYENSGYPRKADGHIEHEAWEIAYKNGRGSYNDKKEKIIFTELASELEKRIETQSKAINNFTTEGVSTAGEHAHWAMDSLTRSVTSSTGVLLKQVSENETKLSKLKSQYYDYALKKQIELTFGNVTADVFSQYRESVDNHFSKISTSALLKLQAIEDKLNSDNPEMFSQALMTCRRLFENISKELFDKYFPNYSEKTYKTKSGKDIDVSGDHYLNKLSAVIENLTDRSMSKSLIGSNIVYLIDRIEYLSNLQSKGVHNEITKRDAMQCIIHTYVCIGDILSLQEE